MAGEERDVAAGRLGSTGAVVGSRQLQGSIDALQRTVDTLTRGLAVVSRSMPALGGAMKSAGSAAQTGNVVAGDIWHGTRNWSGWGQNGGGPRMSTPVQGAAGSPTPGGAPGSTYAATVLGGGRPNGGGPPVLSGGRQTSTSNGGLISFGGGGGVAAAMRGLSVYGNRHFENNIVLDMYGNYAGIGATGSSGAYSYSTNRDSAVTQLIGGGGRGALSVALSAEDAVQGGLSVANATGALYTDARYGRALTSTAGFSYANPAAGFAGGAAAYAQLHSFRANAYMQGLGFGATLGPGGRQASMGTIANNVLSGTLRNYGGRLSSRQYEAMSGQNGSLTYNLNQLVNNGAIDSDTAQAMRLYLRDQVAAQNKLGMSASSFEDVMGRAGRGDSSAQKTLKRAGIGASDMESLSHLDATRRMNEGDQLHGFSQGLQDATSALDKWSRVMNAFMTQTGLNSLIGMASGVNSGVSGVLGAARKVLNPIAGGMLSIFGGGSGGAGTSQASGGMGAQGSAVGHTGSDAVRVAERYLGKPYQWGGSNPQSSFDCSGLVQWAYKQIGVNLPRTAAQQEGVGREVGKNDLRAGDLIFFGEPAHHVGMYVGGGKMVEAPHTGASIRIAGDRIGSASHVRRIVGQAGSLASGPLGSTSTAGGDSPRQSDLNNFGGDIGDVGNYGSVEEIVAVAAGLAGGGGGGSVAPGGWTGTSVGSGGATTAAGNGGTGGTVSTNKALAKRMAAARGWTGSEWSAIDWIVSRESGWNNRDQNPNSTAYGMFQFLDATWGDYGAKKTSDPTAQIQAGLNYIAGRYGDPLHAQAYWQKHHHYDRGTGLAGVKGDQIAKVHDGEIVLPKAQSDLVRAVIRSGTGGEPAKPFPETRTPAVAVTSRGTGAQIVFQAGAIQVMAMATSQPELDRVADYVVNRIASDKRLEQIGTDL